MSQALKIILLVNSARVYARGILRGIARYSQRYGPWSFYNEPGISLDSETAAAWDADGVIAQAGDTATAEAILRLRLPTVLIAAARPLPGAVNLLGDWQADGAMVVEHYLERGFRHFGYCGFSDMDWSHDRGVGFARAVEAAGCVCSRFDTPMFHGPSRWLPEPDRHQLHEWLGSLPKPAGIMACNDDRGRHVIDACRSLDIHVPEQLAVVGVDNDETVCELTYPLLSSLAVNTVKAGYEAAETLARIISGVEPDPPDVVVEPLYVVPRHSSDTLAIEDPALVQATRFIRQHARQAIQVDQVTEAAGVTRRTLERRFRRHLGRSVHDAIQHARVEEIAHLLVETTLPVTEIARLLGHTSAKHLAGYFAAVTGISPTAYRHRLTEH